jgi:hypothetical protein
LDAAPVSGTQRRLATQAGQSALPDICEECPVRAKSGTCVRGRSLPMRLLDYVSNFVLWTYKYDLIFSDEEFIRFYFRHFFHYEGRKFVQSDIVSFVRGNLLDMHVLEIFFYDIVLLCCMDRGGIILRSVGGI